MATLTTHERVTRMLEHRPADRVPIIDDPWAATFERWYREGLPKEADWLDYFGLDRFIAIGVDNSPRYPAKVLEENDEFKIHTSSWGATLKHFKHHGGVPEFLDFTITDRDRWQQAKARMTPDRDRVDWQRLQKEYATWRRQGAWIIAYFWFGFDVTHSWIVGTDRVLMALVEDPDWLVDMFNTELDLNLQLFQMVWDAGYQFDAIRWPDDMGYKHHQFFSLSTYRDLLKPVHKRAADWAHQKGIKVELHSCGDIRPFVPELVEIGIDILNPIEVKAGMDPIALKKQYGDQLTFHGGINAALFWEMDKLYQHMREVIPAMKQNGGYILGSDHSVPDSVSLEQFKQFVAMAKELGSYE